MQTMAISRTERHLYLMRVLNSVSIIAAWTGASYVIILKLSLFHRIILDPLNQN